MNILKKFERGLIVAVSSLLILSVIPGCSDDDGPTNPPVENQTSMISGKVTGKPASGNTPKLSSLQTVEGAAVFAARVKADGSLEVISDTVMTNASGEFTLETEVEGESDVMIIGNKNSSEWKSVVSAELKHNTTVYCAPLSEESTAESEVYAELIGDGNAGMVSYADVQLFISSETAAEINSTSTLAAKIAGAIYAEYTARVEAASDAAIGASATQLKAVADAKASAEVQLDAALYAAGESDAQIDAAFNNYEETMIEAYASSGISVESYAKILEVSTKNMIRSSASVSSDVKLKLEKTASKVKAKVYTEAEKKKMEAGSASATQISAVINAGIQLEVDLDSASNHDEIVAAFDEFHAVVISQISANYTAYASAIASIDAQINSSSGIKATLETSLAAAVNLNMVIEAYMEYYNSCRSLVEASLETASSAEIEVIAEVIIVANLSN
ncbi:MAG: hypothetical protein K9G63_15390 [Melioribacteraceae bacterium]|nr:hypothetical protein [Melioribacteraceae bacterium]